MPIETGIFTYSEDRLQQIWRDFDLSKTRSEHEVYPLSHAEISRGPGSFKQARKLCLIFFENLTKPESHLERLDATYKAVYSPRRLRKQCSEQTVLQTAKEILRQLPATSPTIQGALPFDIVVEPGFLKTNQSQHDGDNWNTEADWDRLLVINFVDTVVLQVVLQIAHIECLYSPYDHKRLFGYPSIDYLLNSAILLLKAAIEMAIEQRDQSEKWLVVCAFLWTSWQRLLALFFRRRTEKQLFLGYDPEVRSFNSLRAGEYVPQIFEFRRRHLQCALERTPYLCPWAYSTLVNDRACLSTDLRRFEQLYHASCGTRSAACIAGPAQCDGKSSYSCRRFEQSQVTNQSFHVLTCTGTCRRLYWDRDSFISVSGPKAIDISACTDDSLHYCESVAKTLTISHVWSHGQGGRPDRCGTDGTGFNSCLHQRYSKIALSLGYQSYWMDTPCIPSEKDLRWDCIANITKIFTTSEATLICDRDIMSIDISSGSIEAYEQVLAVLLVCDWGMRAWTLLESVKGRQSLFLLCLDDKIINLHETLKTVYLRGSMDIAILFSVRPYLLPPRILEHMSLFDEGESLITDDDIEESKHFTVAETAVLLSGRHATRDEDELLIWNLLTGNPEVGDPVLMWRSQIGKRIPTGCLVSSAPRLQGVPGFHWAPCRPSPSRRAVQTTSGAKEYPAIDGSDSKNGILTEHGLLAHWQTYRFPAAVPEAHIVSDPAYDSNIYDIIEKYLQGYEEGVLLRLIYQHGPWKNPMPYRGSSNYILVVCGSHDGTGWIWRGIYEWERTVPLPTFGHADILLI